MTDSTAAELAALRAEIEALRDIVKPPPPRFPDKRPIICFRCDDDERALLDASAAAKGMTRADFVRHCVQEVMQTVFRPRHAMPLGLVGQHRKSRRFHDARTVRPETRDDAARRIVALGVERSALIKQQEAAENASRAIAHIGREKLSEAAGTAPTRKLGR